jgi:hypothetical protein
MSFHRVSRRTRDLGDQRPLSAEQGVEERRLARIGAPGEYEEGPLAQPFGSWSRGDQVLDLARDGVYPTCDLLG